MKIAATLLLGPSSLDDARAAVFSLARHDKDFNTTGAHVDALLILHANPEAEDADDLAADADAFIPHVETHPAPWVDFSHARNLSLDLATRWGADWHLTIDADERLKLPDDMRDQLAHTTADRLYVYYEDRSYAKDRLTRLPTKGRWRGPTHEVFLPPPDPLAFLKGASFYELPKTVDGMRRKSERDVRLLLPYAKAHPTEPHWTYYLAQSYQALSLWEKAASAYLKAANIAGHSELGGLASYRAAESFGHLKKWDEALRACAKGITLCPWMPESAWIAALASLEAGRPLDAIGWARIAAAHGYPEGDAEQFVRVGLSEPVASWEGPYEVLSVAFGQIGKKDDAIEYAKLSGQAKAERLALLPRPAPPMNGTDDRDRPTTPELPQASV